VALAAQASSVEAVRSIYCSIIYETTAYGHKKVTVCEYWRSLVGERIKWTSQEVVSDCILTENKVTGIVRQKDRDRGG